MRTRTKRILSTIAVVVVLIALSLAYREYDERRMLSEQEVLNNLVIDSLDLKDATFDEAIRVIVDKVHAMGHPEFRVVVFSGSTRPPNFHALQNPQHSAEPGAKITVRLTSVSLKPIIGYVGGFGDHTCQIIGHDLLIVPAVGKIERSRKATFLVYEKEIFQDRSDEEILAYFKSNGLTLYEGMKIKYLPQESEVEIVAPEEEVDLFEAIIIPTDVPRTKWEATEWRFYAWRMRLLGF